MTDGAGNVMTKVLFLYYVLFLFFFTIRGRSRKILSYELHAQLHMRHTIAISSGLYSSTPSESSPIGRAGAQFLRSP